jgi:hypothetical protein
VGWRWQHPPAPFYGRSAQFRVFGEFLTLGGQPCNIFRVQGSYLCVMAKRSSPMWRNNRKSIQINDHFRILFFTVLNQLISPVLNQGDIAECSRMPPRNSL